MENTLKHRLQGVTATLAIFVFGVANMQMLDADRSALAVRGSNEQVLKRRETLIAKVAKDKVFRLQKLDHVNSNQTSCEALEQEERRNIILRAQKWLEEEVEYKFTAFHEGYRTQCSGFVSAAWNLNVSHPKDTPRCYNLEDRGLAVAIKKDELRMGDAMVCNSHKIAAYTKETPKKKGQQGGGHCLIFERWTDDSRTAYIGYELCNDATCKNVVRHEIPYPYNYKTRCWEPMRRTVSC